MEASSLTLEIAFSILLITLAYKIYKLKCASHSKCCGENIDLDMSESEPPDINL